MVKMKAHTDRNSRNRALRLMAITMCACMMVTMAPQIPIDGLQAENAYADAQTDKAIMKGTSGISDPVAPATGSEDSVSYTYDYVYMGEFTGSAVKWRVLDADSTNVSTAGMFLLSDKLLGETQFNPLVIDGTTSSAFQGSVAQSWCKKFVSEKLMPYEVAAVMPTTKNDDRYEIRSFSIICAASTGILNNDKVFFLSGEEVDTNSYGLNTRDRRKGEQATNIGGGYVNWWTRSSSGVFVHYDGGIGSGSVDGSMGARPALNLDLSSVLFTSANGGKPDLNSSNPVQAIADGNSQNNEWKLTLKDSARTSFSASATLNGNSLTVSYSNATVGTNEYISVMVENTNGEYTHYGKLKAVGSSSTGEVTFTLTGLNNDDKIFIFNEKCNTGMQTDISSELKLVYTVGSKLPELTMSGFSISSLTEGVPMQSSLANYITGGERPYTFAKVSGPQWISIDTDGKMSGIPTAGNATTLKFKVRSGDGAGGTYEKEFTVNIPAVTTQSPTTPTTPTRPTTPVFSVVDGQITLEKNAIISEDGKTASLEPQGHEISSLISQAEIRSCEEVVVETKGTQEATKLEITLPSASIKEIADSDKLVLSIKTPDTILKLEPDTLKEIASKELDSTISFETLKVSCESGSEADALKELVGESARIVDFDISSGSKKLTSFDDKAIKLLIKVPEELENEELMGFYISDDKKVESIDGKVAVIGGETYYEISTTHLSVYGVAAKESVEKTVKEQLIEAVKAIKLTSMKVTASKGKVKVSWKRAGEQKVTKYQVYRSNSGKKGTYTLVGTTTKWNKTVKTTKLTKGKKYYYKVRGYKVIDGKKYYTKWTSVKTSRAK